MFVLNDSSKNGLLFQSDKNGSVLYRVKSGYVLREIAGEYLAIPVSVQDGAESQIAVLNESGKFLWEQMQQERCFTELLKEMTDYFDVTEAEAEEDIREFLIHLSQYNLITVEERK